MEALDFFSQRAKANRRGLLLSWGLMLLLFVGGGLYLAFDRYGQTAGVDTLAPTATSAERINARIDPRHDANSTEHRRSVRDMVQAGLGVLVFGSIFLAMLFKRYTGLDLLQNPSQIQAYRVLIKPIAIGLTDTTGKSHVLPLRDSRDVPHALALLQQLTGRAPTESS